MATPGSGTEDAQADVVAFLQQGAAFGLEAAARRIDTHGARIFLAGKRAWKLKRAVRFGYLDFSTPDLRREALEAELRLNRRTAPLLYRAVHPIVRTPDGGLRIGGPGPAVDWLLEMRRFPDDALLDDLAARGGLDQQLMIRLADHIHAFHAIADVIATDDGAARLRRVVEGNSASMAAFPTILAPEKADQLSASHLRLTDDLAPLLDARGRAGRIRHAHGDLHLANIALIDGAPTLFDCLEFSVELATIDLLYDLAFLLMDLWHRGLRTKANLLFNRYLDLSPEDEAGVALLPLFLSVRAAIRAHVLAAQSQNADPDGRKAGKARSYLDLALALVEPEPTRMVAIGGLSGTGKSSLARLIGGGIGRAPGARILRSDVLRKRLAGLPPEARLPKESYTSQSSAQVYASTEAMVTQMLALGQSVVIDAVLARQAERLKVASIAGQAGATFVGLWLETSDETRVARIAQRDADASDADSAVAQAQSGLDIGDLGNWQRLSADGSPDAVAMRARKVLGLEPAPSQP